VAAYRRAAELGDGEALLRLGNWHAGLEPAPLSTESAGSNSPKLTPSSTSAFSAVSAATRASALKYVWWVFGFLAEATSFNLICVLSALVPRDDAAAVECYRQGIELANHVVFMLTHFQNVVTVL
jgi:TPR repeat protein